MAAPATQQTQWPAIAPRFKPVASKIVKERTAKPLDNLTGGIAWGNSYEMDAFLEMYRATGDTDYLDYFVKLADGVAAARADVRGELDWQGKSPKGWLTGAHYTVGTPVDLLDKDGQKALEVQTVARSGNNSTTVEVMPADDGKTFTLRVFNDFRKAKPAIETFEGLTPANVEAKVNTPPEKVGSVRVKSLGATIPRAYAPFIPPVGLVALHGHHTGRIVSPLAQFAAIVKAEPKLAKYSAKAAIYLASAETAITEMDPIWTDKGDYGYFNFEKGIPFWSDGVPEPLNVQAASGSAYLNLYDATGNPLYLERATKLARLIQREFEPQDDGTFLYRYWFGVVRTGWKPEDNVSVNTPYYAGQMTLEDLSHFQLSMRFMVEAYQHGLVFTRDDLEKWATTFHKKLLLTNPDGSKTLAFRVDGERPKVAGTYDYSTYGLTQLDIVDPSVTEAARALYEKEFTPIDTRPSTLYGWSVLARVEAERAKNAAAKAP